MRQYRLLAALLSLILLTCLFGVEAQYNVPQQQGEVVGQTTPYTTETVGYPTAAQTSQLGQASQYYSTGPASNAHITAPQPFVTEGNTPSTVYFGQQQQPVAYSQYQSTPSTGNTLWIKGSDSWTQYAEVPQGAVVTLLALSSTGGSGSINEIHPNGQTYSYNYHFYPTSQLTFDADAPGRYTLSSVVAGQESNQVIIDVKRQHTLHPAIIIHLEATLPHIIPAITRPIIPTSVQSCIPAICRTDIMATLIDTALTSSHMEL